MDAQSMLYMYLSLWYVLFYIFQVITPRHILLAVANDDELHKVTLLL